jgi:hypothetical protein
MIQVIAKKSIQFNLRPVGSFWSQAQVTIQPWDGRVWSLPAWVQTDPIYAWSIADGSLEVIQ